MKITKKIIFKAFLSTVFYLFLTILFAKTVGYGKGAGKFPMSWAEILDWLPFYILCSCFMGISSALYLNNNDNEEKNK